jgi:hypothetical protein
MSEIPEVNEPSQSEGDVVPVPVDPEVIVPQMELPDEGDKEAEIDEFDEDDFDDDFDDDFEEEFKDEYEMDEDFDESEFGAGNMGREFGGEIEENSDDEEPKSENEGKK